MRKRHAWLAILFGIMAVCTTQCLGVDVTTMCTVALKIDCVQDYIQQTDETLCATNGNTYANLCFFSKDKCQQPGLNINYFGACKTATTTPESDTASTRPPPSTTTTTTKRTTSQATAPTTRSQPPPTTTTTAALPTTTVDEYEILRRVFCAPESQVNCELFAHSPYCGSNLRIYNNECEFVKAQCKLDIKPLDMTHCTASTSNPRRHLRRHQRP